MRHQFIEDYFQVNNTVSKVFSSYDSFVDTNTTNCLSIFAIMQGFPTLGLLEMNLLTKNICHPLLSDIIRFYFQRIS